jgi:hypothetical protein
MKVGEAIERIKGCAFELDASTNHKRSRDLLDMRITLEKKCFDLKESYKKEWNQALMNLPAEKSNKETREAKIELELSGHDSEKYKEVEMLLGLVNAVEHHNATTLTLFFEGNRK